MMAIKNIPFKKILIASLWVMIGTGGLLLLISAMEKKSTELCSGYEINITGVNDHFFVNTQDIVKIIENVSGKGIKGKSVQQFPLSTIEKKLKNEPWISSAELFFDRNNKLIVQIEEKNPIARIFRQNGTSFYIDHKLNMLPKSGLKSARLPVFTGFPAVGNVLLPADSNLLKEIGELSLFIQKDSFMTAMLDQIDIRSDRTFSLIPKLGDQIILFGDAKNMEEKFKKLRLFYDKVIPIRGWNAYQQVNLQFKDQIVASIKGREEMVADSMKTINMLKAMADMAQRMSGDTSQSMVQDNAKNTTDVNLILESFARDDMPGDDGATVPASTNKTEKNAVLPLVKAPVTKVETLKKSTPKVEKKKVQTEDKKNKVTPKPNPPKATQKQNDYK
jgi:cell division protein FtsQ